MKVTNTSELSSFMDQLKDWCRLQSFETLLAAIDAAENSSFTASELILKYAEVLKRFKDQLPDRLPTSFRESWASALYVAETGVDTVQYETKKRSLFSFG